MSRNLLIAIFVSLLLHGGAAGSGYFFKKAPVQEAVETDVPTVMLDLPPPPEPDEPEIVENTSDAPAEIADLAPPMQNDMPSAVIDSPFVQQIQAPPPPGLNRSAGAITIPTNTRPAVGGGKALGVIFDLAALDQKPEPTIRIKPIYPFELRRSGLKGAVTVGFIVDSNGDVRDPYIIKSSSPAFEDAALQAVLKWKFRPGKKGGKAVNTRVAQPLDFSINAQ